MGEGAVAFTIDLAACFLFFVLKKNFVLFLELVKTKKNICLKSCMPKSMSGIHNIHKEKKISGYTHKKGL